MTVTEGPPGIATTKTIIATKTGTIAGHGIGAMTTMIGTAMSGTAMIGTAMSGTVAIATWTTITTNDTGLVAVDDDPRLGVEKNADLAVVAESVVAAERAASVGTAAAR
jgi:hypothetical protein